MKYYKGDMTEDELLRYVENHSQTERALFPREIIAEILRMNGECDDAKEVINGVKKWYSVDLSFYVKEIKKNENKD